MVKGGNFKNILYLSITVLIWGIAFVSQSKGMECMKAFTFMSARNILAVLVLLPLVIARLKQGIINLKPTVAGGILCGVALSVADYFQNLGISMTSVGKTGFITALYIIFTPLLGVFLHKRVGMKIWFCTLLAVVGMYFICITENFSVNMGDIYVLICAVLFAVHILVIDRYVKDCDGVVLSFVQFFACAVICTFMSLIFEKPTAGQLKEGLIPILYAGILSSGVGYTLQTVGQKGLNPTVAALILSMESVVAVIAGYLAYSLGILNTDQSLTTRQLLGCGIVFIAVILVQLPALNERKLAYGKNSVEELQ